MMEYVELCELWYEIDITMHSLTNACAETDIEGLVWQVNAVMGAEMIGEAITQYNNLCNTKMDLEGLITKMHELWYKNYTWDNFAHDHNIE